MNAGENYSRTSPIFDVKRSGLPILSNKTFLSEYSDGIIAIFRQNLLENSPTIHWSMRKRSLINRDTASERLLPRSGIRLRSIVWGTLPYGQRVMLL